MSLLFVLIVSLVEIIPYIGGFTSFAVSMIGLGILLLNLIGKKNLDNNTVEEVNTVITEETK